MVVARSRYLGVLKSAVRRYGDTGVNENWQAVKGYAVLKGTKWLAKRGDQRGRLSWCSVTMNCGIRKTSKIIARVAMVDARSRYFGVLKSAVRRYGHQ